MLLVKIQKLLQCIAISKDLPSMIVKPFAIL